MQTRAFLIASVLVGACTFDEPSFDKTAFACDDAHPCPNPQRCVAGTCSGGTSDGVACGAAGQCAPGNSCCASSTGASQCVPLGQACNGRAAACDGPSDCETGVQCCNATEPVCDPDGCTPSVCSSNADCSGVLPTCCFLSTSPWGICGRC